MEINETKSTEQDLPIRWSREHGVHGHIFAGSGNLAKLTENEYRNFSIRKFYESFRSSVGAGIVVPTKFFRLECTYARCYKELVADILLCIYSRRLSVTDEDHPASGRTTSFSSKYLGRERLSMEINETKSTEQDLPIRWSREHGVHGHIFAGSGNLAKLTENEYRNFSIRKFYESFRSSVGAGIVVPTKFFRLECTYARCYKELVADILLCIYSRRLSVTDEDHPASGRTTSFSSKYLGRERLVGYGGVETS
ncbi:hypothetical protein TIFTF001_055046, partial [Ficus carica]